MAKKSTENRPQSYVSRKEPDQQANEPKRRVVAYLPQDVWQRVQNAVDTLPSLTITSFVTYACREAITQLEELHNNGKPFERRATKAKSVDDLFKKP